MPLQDVSNDPTMIDWLRQSGHAHVLDERLLNPNVSASPPPFNIPYGQSTSLSSPIHGFNMGYTSSSPQINSVNRSSSFLQPPYHSTSSYEGAAHPLSPLLVAPSYGHQSSPIHFTSSPTQFLSPDTNRQQIDADIENMKRDPNTRVLQRPPQEDVVYKQRVFVRYLQPPTPPVGGTIIVIKRAPPAPPTPPPVTIRERPPPMPSAEGTTVIDKIVPPGPKPPRQVIIEQYPPLPPKPRDVIIERWLPLAPRQRRILYERLPPPIQQATRPIIVQYGSPHVRVQREVVMAPATQLPYQQVACHTDINQLLSQIGGNQAVCSTLPPSSLVSYNPYTSIQPNCGIVGQPQPNIVILQNGQSSTMPSSIYGMPLTCVCTPSQISGLGAYGCGVSTVPASGLSTGQTAVFNVPDNVPIDNVLRQLGIDPHTIQRSSNAPFPDPQSAVSNVWNAISHASPSYPMDPRSAVSHVWNAASHASPSYPTDPRSAVSHVWNAAARASPSYPTDPKSAVSHVWDAAVHANPSFPMDPRSAVSNVWNAAAHMGDYNRPTSPTVGQAWEKIEQYLRGQPNNAVQSVWNQMSHPSSSPPQSIYPPAPMPPNYPPPPTNYPPPSGGMSSAGASVLARLFGGGQ
ncbi:unnamed protein product [Rotaria sordida]|uniref:Uncharacterized protein n=1 Tax=Rotaria sordida TaxID=392033 RepID=A0A813MUN3_9BILA|nr:unnamed protein product [Rotaria sordida]CAF0730805.1 unnamed protein product [Rotaria sordida]CAF0732250.1 unnamed protein product [Rotaria sordida]